MSDFMTITGHHTQEDWMVEGSWGRLHLFKPGAWSYSETRGLSYYPQDSVRLPKNPRIALWVARWIVYKYERAKRREWLQEQRVKRVIRKAKKR